MTDTNRNSAAEIKRILVDQLSKATGAAAEEIQNWIDVEKNDSGDLFIDIRRNSRFSHRHAANAMLATMKPCDGSMVVSERGGTMLRVREYGDDFIEQLKSDAYVDQLKITLGTARDFSHGNGGPGRG
jgi:hypothetical protein